MAGGEDKEARGLPVVQPGEDGGIEGTEVHIENVDVRLVEEILDRKQRHLCATARWGKRERKK